MGNNTFDGNTKHEVPFLFGLEQKWISKTVPHLPTFLNGYSLTWCNAAWSAIIIATGWLARTNLHWLWATISVIILQYITDCLDGAVGRYRHTGLVRWGYYMDHLLDFVFAGSLILAYALALPNHALMFFVTFILIGGMYANTYLTHSITRRFKMSYGSVGTTELRIVVIALDIAIIGFGTHWFVALVPYCNLAFFTTLCIAIYKQQKELLQKDCEDKDNSSE